jgi:hypothetical protein
MKNSLIGCTAGLAIQPLTWNAVALTTTSASYVSLASLATFTPNTLAVISQTTSYYGYFLYRFAVTSGVLPAWIINGAAISVAASVTISGKSYTVSSEYIIQNVDSNGLYFDVARPKVGASDAVELNTAFAATALDNGSGNVITPLVTLIMQAQKAMFQCTNGSVSIAPVVDHSGNAPYSIPLVPLATPGQEYEVTAQVASKFDLKDWYVKSTNAGSSTLAIRFF